MTASTLSSAAGQIDLEQPIIIVPAHDIKIRMLHHSDVAVMAKHGNNRKIAQNMRARWPEPYTEDSGHEFTAMIRNKNNWKSTMSGRPASQSGHDAAAGQLLPTAWAITMKDEIIGTIGYEFPTDIEIRSVEFGYWIAEAYWGKGIATEIVKVFVPWFWKTYPYIVRLEAQVYGWNPASARVLEKSGFELEGRRRAAVWRYERLTDALVYSCIREGVAIAHTAPPEKDTK